MFTTIIFIKFKLIKFTCNFMRFYLYSAIVSSTNKTRFLLSILVKRFKQRGEYFVLSALNSAGGVICLFNKVSKVWISTDFKVSGLVGTPVWKSTTCFSEEWRISLIVTYTVLGTIKKWQWHGFWHGNLSSLIRIYHKNFERRFFF